MKLWRGLNRVKNEFMRVVVKCWLKGLMSMYMHFYKLFYLSLDFRRNEIRLVSDCSDNTSYCHHNGNTMTVPDSVINTISTDTMKFWEIFFASQSLSMLRDGNQIFRIPSDGKNIGLLLPSKSVLIRAMFSN